MGDYNKIFKNKNFLYLWSSQILSQLSINIMNFLLLIKLFNETGSAIATSLLWVSYALPAIFIGPFAAASVDMVERKKILKITNLFQSLTIFLYAFIHDLRVFLIYGVAVVYSFLNQFYVPAESASLPSLVKKEDYPHANSLFFLTQQTSMIIGFGIAGLLHTVFGFEFSLFLCAIFLFIAFISVTFLPALPVQEDTPKNFEEGFFKFFRRIMEGYNFIKNNNTILIPFSLLIILQISLAMVIINVPVFAQEIFSINVNSAGVFLVVPAGIGAAIGAVLIPKLIKKGSRKKAIIEKGFMLMVFSTLLLTFLVPLTHGFLSKLIGMITVALMGLSFISIFIPSQTYIQEKTPGGLRGRVFGNFWFLSTIATIFPVVFSGAIVELFGAKLLTFMMGVVYFGILVFSRKLGPKYLSNGLLS